jgi:predicted amidophosphoribosyltransferase
MRKLKTGRMELNLNKAPCPACGSVLMEGEKVKSVAYSAGKEKIILLYGCPSCYPGGKGIKRICPVCSKELSGKGYLLGKMWEKEENRLRLHILGCSICRPNAFIIK